MHIKKLAAGVALASLLVISPARAITGDQDAQILHLLNRISFGPAPGDIEAVKRMGIEAYIDQQLHPNFAEPAELQKRLVQMPSINMSMQQMAANYKPPGSVKNLSEQQRQEAKEKLKGVLVDLVNAKLARAIASPAQLQEVMTDFWFNHFNVFFGKGPVTLAIGSYERDAIRPYVFGKFRDLLEATAKHPAMLYYLDNWQNTDPKSQIAQIAAQRRGKELGINENYAREIMELHTLGVDGGYTQTDVTTLAHILTGWGVARGQGIAERASFYFDPMRHDSTDKVFLGQPFKGGGQEEIERALDILARHPSTAHHISFQLAQYFVADEPPQSLVDHLASVFQQTDGDIASVLRALFASQEFWDPKYEQVKFKSPFRFVVSMFRANGIMPPEGAKRLQGAISQMGEALYRCQTPNGYAHTNAQWLNSDAVLKRVNLVQSFANYLGGNTLTIEKALGNNWSANTLGTVQKAPANEQAALLLGSPEFLYY